VDLQASVAELVYGEPLKIPSERLTLTVDPLEPVLITQLHQQMACLRPVPAECYAYIRAQGLPELYVRLPPSGMQWARL
jgi:hypothetical protein